MRDEKRKFDFTVPKMVYLVSRNPSRLVEAFHMVWQSHAGLAKKTSGALENSGKHWIPFQGLYTLISYIKRAFL